MTNFILIKWTPSQLITQSTKINSKFPTRSMVLLVTNWFPINRYPAASNFSKANPKTQTLSVYCSNSYRSGGKFQILCWRHFKWNYILLHNTNQIFIFHCTSPSFSLWPSSSKDKSMLILSIWKMQNIKK